MIHTLQIKLPHVEVIEFFAGVRGARSTCPLSFGDRGGSTNSRIGRWALLGIGSMDGEVNSHAVWPSEDGSIVVEGEEDFGVNQTGKIGTVDGSSVVVTSGILAGNTYPAGTYSAHNVIVESLGNKVKAYIAWYSDGMMILDISDPYNPVETARYTAQSEVFWGVYKETNSPWFYGTDRNGSLAVFKEFGSGPEGKK